MISLSIFHALLNALVMAVHVTKTLLLYGSY